MRHETYLLHIYRSRAVSGRQWAAQVDDLRGRESRRFTDPEVFLAYLGTMVWAGEPSMVPSHPDAGSADDGATAVGG